MYVSLFAGSVGRQRSCVAKVQRPLGRCAEVSLLHCTVSACVCAFMRARVLACVYVCICM